MQPARTNKIQLPTELTDSQALLLHSIVYHKKIICQCVTDSDLTPDVTASDLTPDDQQIRFSMPVGYTGLVELLSENGESAPPLTLISEVASSSADKFLIRSRVTCLAEVTDKTSTRTLERGSVLNVKGTAKVTCKQQTESYLHCTDREGFYLYLNYKTSGIFSPFAGPKNISGVHTIDSLLKRFRLPCTVRVVSGKIPRQACDTERPGVFRLLSLRKEKTAMMAPLSARQMIVPIPLKTDVEFYKSANMKELSEHYIFLQLLDTCSNKVERYLQTMHVLVSSGGNKRGAAPNKEDEHRLFEDVDEIYPYIRRGGIPSRMMRAQSLDGNDTSPISSPTSIYSRSNSHPVIGGSRERSGSLAVSQVVKQHTVSSAKTETTLQFQCTSSSLTLRKTDVLRQFIEKYTSKESLQSRSSHDQSVGSADEDVYFTLDSNGSHHRPSSVKDILLPTDSQYFTNRG